MRITRFCQKDLVLQFFVRLDAGSENIHGEWKTPANGRTTEKMSKCKRLSLSMTKLQHERRSTTLMYQSGGNEISVNKNVYINK